MAFNFMNLDEETRKYMIDEINADIASGKLYQGKRLNEQGIADYPKLLISAANNNNEIWLSQQLQGKFKTKETRELKGKIIEADVPVTAAEILSESEFNRFYMRAVCLRAMAHGITSVIAYRAKEVSNARSASEQLVGQAFDPAALLEDLRNSIGSDGALGLPPGPNSGISIKLVS